MVRWCLFWRRLNFWRAIVWFPNACKPIQPIPSQSLPPHLLRASLSPFSSKAVRFDDSSRVTWIMWIHLSPKPFSLFPLPIRSPAAPWTHRRKLHTLQETANANGSPTRNEQTRRWAPTQRGTASPPGSGSPDGVCTLRPSRRCAHCARPFGSTTFHFHGADLRLGTCDCAGPGSANGAELIPARRG